MEKITIVRMAILFLIITALSGCIWVPVDDGYRGDGYRERGHEEHRRERHEDRRDRRY